MSDNDVESVILGGNLSEIAGDVHFLDTEDDAFNDLCGSEDIQDKIKFEEGSPCTIEDYKQAGRKLEDLYGINLLDASTKLLLNGQLDAEEFAIQGLAYKLQTLLRGSRGIR